MAPASDRSILAHACGRHGRGLDGPCVRARLPSRHSVAATSTLLPVLCLMQISSILSCNICKSIDGMNLRQLGTLITIADAGSLARAAGRLNLSQPAASRQIHALEVDL